MQRQSIHAASRGEGEALLLVHGDFSNSRLAWREQWQALAEHHRLIAIDRRGYGQSPKEPTPYTFASEAADLAAAMDAAGIKTAHVVGHSYGGLIALSLAVGMPERVQSLHLIEPPLLALLSDDADVAQMIAASEKIYRQAPEWTAEQITLAFFSMVASPEFAASLPDKSVWPEFLDAAKRIEHQQLPGEYSKDVLGQIDPGLAVQVYRGGKSHPVLRKVAAAVATALPQAKLIDIPEAYHDVQRAGDPFNQALLAVTKRSG